MSGGCVEGAVYELAQSVVADRRPHAAALRRQRRRRLRGRADLRRHPRRVRREGRPSNVPRARRDRRRRRGGRPVAVVDRRGAPGPGVGRRGGWSSGPTAASAGVARLAARRRRGRRRRAGLLASGHDQTLTYGPDGERRGEGMRVFVWSFAPAPRMLVFGAIDFAAAVARMGDFLGYHVTVCDARPVFATATRVPVAPTRSWSSGRTSTSSRGRGRPHRPAHRAVRAHPRPEVRRAAARGGPAAARGRVRRGDGVPAHPRGPDGPARRGRAHRRGAGRLSSPIGLDLGARTPEETAVSIAARRPRRRSPGRA